MNWTDYKKEVMRTAAANPGPMGLAVFALGLVGEAGEVIDTKPVSASGTGDIVKELGDVAWYLGAIHERLCIPLETETVQSPEDAWAAIRLVQAAAAVADYIKKVVGHGIEIDMVKMESLLRRVREHWVASVYQYTTLTTAEVRAKNVEKLRARYPAGFDSKRAAAHSG